MHACGYLNMDMDGLNKAFTEVDLDKNQTISFKEFLTMMKKYTSSSQKRGSISEFVDKTGKVMQVVGDDKGFTSYSFEERSAYAKVISECLCNDSDCKKYYPIDPESDDLFKILIDGVVLCKLINCAEQGVIDERAINKKQNMNIFLMNENLRLAINASKTIGCKVISIFPDSI
jgi:hypothetical protein